MSLIHIDPVCRNIAIWYDEYLIPGENFSDMIEAALDKSEIFTLLVTPNLVNESNYVRDVEYPEAKKSEKPIYPAMMQDTDIDQLKSQYESIPYVIDIRSDEMARAAFIESVKHLAKQRSENDPEHDFLIGLAYLDGIDTERDIFYGAELIKRAANDGLYEAMDKLQKMYANGEGVPYDKNKIWYWCEKKLDCLIDKFGEENEKTLSVMNELALEYGGNDFCGGDTENGYWLKKALKHPLNVVRKCAEFLAKIIRPLLIRC